MRLCLSWRTSVLSYWVSISSLTWVLLKLCPRMTHIGITWEGWGLGSALKIKLPRQPPPHQSLILKASAGCSAGGWLGRWLGGGLNPSLWQQGQVWWESLTGDSDTGQVSMTVQMMVLEAGSWFKEPPVAGLTEWLMGCQEAGLREPAGLLMTDRCLAGGQGGEW